MRLQRLLHRRNAQFFTSQVQPALRWAQSLQQRAKKNLSGTQESTEVPQTQDESLSANILQRRSRGRPPKNKREETKRQRKKLNHEKTMREAIKGSAFVEHSSQCSLDL
ncbi:hypothetical protein M513_00886 [Trichuris suis]|uniref:Uncharacterized protein n=1 Tax=Trichuris suis TaxID=68888 RepID=A0A085MLM7_9BILA|nr:hypothetical protein M513_00886 [Trichuris suis]